MIHSKKRAPYAEKAVFICALNLKGILNDSGKYFTNFRAFEVVNGNQKELEGGDKDNIYDENEMGKRSSGVFQYFNDMLMNLN